MRITPQPPAIVSNPQGKASMKSRQCAISAAARISASAAAGIRVADVQCARMPLDEIGRCVARQMREQVAPNIAGDRHEYVRRRPAADPAP